MTDSYSDEGDLFFSIRFPYPWPPKAPPVLKQRLGDCDIEITVGIHSAIHARLLNSGTVRWQILSLPFRVECDATAVIRIVWSEGNVRIFANKLLIASSNRSDAPDLNIIFRHEENADTAHDFSEKNNKAISKRRGQFIGAIKNPDPGFGGIDYIFHSLAEEIDQVTSLLSLIRSGQHFHAAGLAARLRLLVYRDDHLPLLQAAAGAKNAPLLAYTLRSKSKFLDIHTDVNIACADINAAPTDLYDNPIDLDVWLDLPAMTASGIRLNHSRVIGAIGNTRGSHLDFNIPPSVASLRSGTVESNSSALSHFTTYLLDVGDVTLSLARAVLTWQECPVSPEEYLDPHITS